MVELIEVDRIISRHGARRDHVIGVLLDCQERFRYLPRPLIEHVSSRLAIPLVEVLGVASFYRGFSLKPVGRRPVAVCTGTACQVLGARRLVDAFARELRVGLNEMTPDGEFSLHTVNCPGCCGLAPVVTIGAGVHGKVSQAAIPRLLRRYRVEPRAGSPAQEV